VALSVRLIAGSLPRPRDGGRRAWLTVCALLVLPALLIPPGSGIARLSLAWTPALAWSQPWRWWSAAWVHLSELHLLANLTGAMLVLLFGALARLPRDAAWAWALAWPLTHLSLLLTPELARYGGLSGVLHAGVAVVAVTLMHGSAGRATRWLGAAVGLGLLLKVVGERPWAQTLVVPPGWDIAVVPLAHASGAFWGALLAVLLPRVRGGRNG
jgi:rhomboid family GlyGly-CTERM serine protease